MNNRTIRHEQELLGAGSYRADERIGKAGDMSTALEIFTDAVAAAYPELQRSLVSEGSEADVAGLAFDAHADGYEFGGERVKKPPKRRLTVQPAAAVH